MEPPIKKKRIPAYETRAFAGKVLLDPATGKKRISLDHPTYYDHEIQGFQLNALVTVKVTDKKPKRTDAQNRYMHLYFSLIAKSSGHSVNEIKAWAKGKFLSKGIKEVFGDKVRKVTDTSQLKVLEMVEFIERIEQDTGVSSPDPAPFNMPLTKDEYQELKQKQVRLYKRYKPMLTK